MRIGTDINSQLSQQVGEAKDSLGGSTLLAELGDRVKNALEIKGAGNSGEMKIDPQEVKNMIAEISAQPLPGMIQNAVI